MGASDGDNEDDVEDEGGGGDVDGGGPALDRVHVRFRGFVILMVARSRVAELVATASTWYFKGIPPIAGRSPRSLAAESTEFGKIRAKPTGCSKEPLRENNKRPGH